MDAERVELSDRKIASELSVNPGAVAAARALFAGGATVPFVARYRREETGGMDEVQLRQLLKRQEELADLEKRRSYILRTLSTGGHLTRELEGKIRSAEDGQTLEDLYGPFRKRKKSRADRAREAGLEEAAKALLLNSARPPREIIGELKPRGVSTVDALQGVKDILAEQAAHDVEVRRELRRLFVRQGALKSVKKNADADRRFSDYFEWREPAYRTPSHRVLAILRGGAENALTVSLRPPDAAAVRIVATGLPAKGEKGDGGTGDRGGQNREWTALLREIAEDAWRRLLLPSLEREAIGAVRDLAFTRSVEIFQRNLEALLMAPPFGARPVVAIDPGLKTGCKVVALGAGGEILETAQIFPLEPRNDEEGATEILRRMCRLHGAEAIAVGNGTGGRETEEFVGRRVVSPEAASEGVGIPVVAVDESGASVYSTSEIAREEFPDLDMYYRSAVSIGRRLQDPLAELVKIEPSSIGVGQYQHDIPPKMLQNALGTTVESCVNRVGVDVNTAGAALLSRVAGLSATAARNIVEYRQRNGLFRRRQDIGAVAGIGAKTVEQAVGFLRCPRAADPLENTGIHPERYDIVQKIAGDLQIQVRELLGNTAVLNGVSPERYVDHPVGVGIPTITDILSDLAHPGRDPRERFVPVAFSSAVRRFEDVAEGMVLAGVVRNVTAFGAFVDIGVHQDGLVHVSEISDSYVADPAEVVHPGMHVTVKVIHIDQSRRRIGLSMKAVS